MEACWDQLTGKNCRPYGDTNAMVHQQVLLDLGGGDSCHESNPAGGSLLEHNLILNRVSTHTVWVRRIDLVCSTLYGLEALILYLHTLYG